METRDKYINLTELLGDVLWNGLNDRNSPEVEAFITDILDKYDMEDKCYNYLLFLFISYIEIQCNFVPALALQLKELKIKLLLTDIGSLPSLTSAFHNQIFLTDDGTGEVYQEIDGIKIFKQYLPSNNSFTLPAPGSFGPLRVRTQDEDGITYETVVEIDHMGRVQKIIEAPKSMEKPSIDGDEIYSELMSKIMDFDSSLNK